MPSAFSPAIENRFRNSTPYSSTVLVREVATRQLAASRLYVGSPWLSTGAAPLPSLAKTPSTVFVLPTSMTSSIISYQSFILSGRIACHPERKNRFAKRSYSGVEGPLLLPDDQEFPARRQDSSSFAHRPA